jgi:hypothetical protein
MLMSEYIHNTAPVSEPLAREMFDFVYAACVAQGCDCVDICGPNCGGIRTSCSESRRSASGAPGMGFKLRKSSRCVTANLCSAS